MKSELEKKILEEQSMKEKAENKLINLEQEEIEIMKRIRTTTQVHKASNNFFMFLVFYFQNNNFAFCIGELNLLYLFLVVEDYEKINIKNLSGSKEGAFVESPSKKNY